MSAKLHVDNDDDNAPATTCIVRYIGRLAIKVSMKTLDFKTRSAVAKVSISKVCEAAGLKNVDKRRKVDKRILRALADAPDLDGAGTDVYLNISSSRLLLTAVESGATIADHDMPRISFASGGDTDTMDFVAYIAKDANDWRACYVLECSSGTAKDVIAAMGQAFELRYKQYVKPAAGALSSQAVAPRSSSSSSAAAAPDADKDYYNDLPGKMPPDVGPPPVPPLPTVVPPLTTLPPIVTASVDVVDDNNADRHNYVNESAASRDIFDMQPFNNHAAIARQLDADRRAELATEPWFHGRVDREQAERLLQRDGDFLVRESPKTDDQYVLSGMLDNTRKHLLLIDPDGYVRTKDRMFRSIGHLIKYHCENALPIISAESALVLRTPVPRGGGGGARN